MDEIDKKYKLVRDDFNSNNSSILCKQSVLFCILEEIATNDYFSAKEFFTKSQNCDFGNHIILIVKNWGYRIAIKHNVVPEDPTQTYKLYMTREEIVELYTYFKLFNKKPINLLDYIHIDTGEAGF